MELTRRDAAAALAALGVSGVTATAGRSLVSDETDDAEETPDFEKADGTDDEAVRETLGAAAAVVYPSELDNVEGFVSAFLDGRLDDADHADGIRAAVAELEDRAVAWYEDSFAALSPSTRDSLLREMGVDTAEPVPEGTTAERVRFYVVNELLLALYSSPAGGELVGIENPQGHPGGTETYQRGPGP